LPHHPPALLARDGRGVRAQLFGIPAAIALAPETLARPEVLASVHSVPKSLGVAGADYGTLGYKKIIIFLNYLKLDVKTIFCEREVFLKSTFKFKLPAK
jgi:hypothetical protein